MKRNALVYIASIIATGLGTLIYDVSHWQSGSLPRLFLYTLVTIAGSLMKIRLPGITGTMSVYFFFLLVGLTQLPLPEILVVGMSAVLVQCFWQARKRPKPVQVLFNLGSTAIAIHYAYQTFHIEWLAGRDFGLPVQMAAASLVFFLLNTGLIAGVVALTEGKVIHRVWRECYLWCFPYYLLGAALAGGFNHLSGAIGWQAALLMLPVVYLVYGSSRMYFDKLEAEKDHVTEVAALHLRTIQALALAIDAKDHTTRDHLERVQVFAVEMGKELGLGNEDLRALEAASLLHDIGKLAVPEHILSKPGKLTPEEFEKMKIHPIIGAEIIETVEFPYPVAPIVQAHHEKWDGSGYPYGLRGEEIPLGARILSVVDCLDALSSERPYRRAITLDAAVQHIESESGKSYDPKVVALLSRNYKIYESRLKNGAEPLRAPRLSHEVRIPPGKAPAAGFETSAGVRNGHSREVAASDFLGSIANARHEAQTLFELVQSLGTSLSLDDTLSMMASRLGRLIEFDALAVYLIENGILKPKFVAGVDSRLLGSLQIPYGHGVSGWVAEHKTPVLNGEPGVEPVYGDDFKVLLTLKSALSVPLIQQEKEVGVVTLYSLEPDHFSRDEVRILQAIASKLAMSVENAKRFEEAESSATVDYLTGLANARALSLRLEEEISRCSRGNETLAVVVCDLDNFKEVNDRFGHMQGNELLKDFAREIQSRVRTYDFVARMGGDEFVILLPNMPAGIVSAKVAELGLVAAEASRRICGEELVTVSCGVALLGEDGDRTEDLLTAADRRMYEHKAIVHQAQSLRSMARTHWQSARLQLVS